MELGEIFIYSVVYLFLGYVCWEAPKIVGAKPFFYNDFEEWLKKLKQEQKK